MQMNGVLPNGLGDEKGPGTVVYLELGWPSVYGWCQIPDPCVSWGLGVK